MYKYNFFNEISGLYLLAPCRFRAACRFLYRIDRWNRPIRWWQRRRFFVGTVGDVVRHLVTRTPFAAKFFLGILCIIEKVSREEANGEGRAGSFVSE